MFASRLIITVEFAVTVDLLKKLKGDCIKSMDDTPYKKVVAMLESFASELCDYFRVLRSATGTLGINITFPGITLRSVVCSAVHPMKLPQMC